MTFLDSISERSSVVYRAKLGRVFEPRFFCCDDPNALGISEGKDPVCNLAISPNPCFVGETVNYSAGGSYDPDGTVTEFRWTFPGGNPSSSTTQDGTVTWAQPGTYRVTLTVRDGTNLRSRPCETDVVVSNPEGIYYAGSDTGVWYTEDGGASWAARNTGLSGDSLIVRDLRIDKHPTIWIATKAAVYASNNGGVNWTDHTPNPAGSPDRTGQEFDFIHIGKNYLYVLAHLGTDQSFVYYTDQHLRIRGDMTTPLTWFDFFEAPA